MCEEPLSEGGAVSEENNWVVGRSSHVRLTERWVPGTVDVTVYGTAHQLQEVLRRRPGHELRATAVHKINLLAGVQRSTLARCCSQASALGALAFAKAWLTDKPR
jgi:hypothetical protein